MHDGAMPDGHVIADRCRVRTDHDVHDCAVLQIRPRANPDPVHVAAYDRVHPDTAGFANLHVTNHLGAAVHVRARMHCGCDGFVGAEHLTMILRDPATNYFFTVGYAIPSCSR